MKNFSFTYLGPRYWPVYLAIVLLWPTVYLPWRLKRLLGRGIGRCLFHLARRHRKIAAINMGLCFPSWEAPRREQLLRDNFAAIGEGILEMVAAWWAPERAFNGLLTLKNRHYMDEALMAGRGVIMLGPHFVTIDIIGRLFPKDLPLHVTYQASRNILLNKLMTNARLRNVTGVIPREAVRSVVRALQANQIVWLAPDRDARQRGSEFAPFFGVLAATTTVVARYARMSGATIVPFLHARTEDGGYLAEFLPPLENFPAGDKKQDAATINAVLEQMIVRYPEQYMWAYWRFKTRPPGEKSFYK